MRVPFESNYYANGVFYSELTNWLINAFNGEWLKVADAKPAWQREKK